MEPELENKVTERTQDLEEKNFRIADDFGGTGPSLRPALTMN
jgi:hypothetical protein